MHNMASIDTLLQNVEPLSHIRRCATLVEFGRSAITASGAESQALQSVIAALGASSQVHYHRLLAAYALCGVLAEARKVGQSVPVALLNTASSLLADTSPKVSQVLAAPMLISSLSDDQQKATMTGKLLQDARLKEFKHLIHRLAQAKQTQVLQQLYQAHTMTDPAKAQLLLGSLDPEAFAQLPKEEQSTLDTAGLRLLCRYRPRWVVQYLTSKVQEQVRHKKSPDVSLKGLVTKAFVFLATRGASRHGLSLFTDTAHHLALEHETLKTVLTRHYLSVFPVDIGLYLLEGDGQHIMKTLSSPLYCLMSSRAWRRFGSHTDLLVRMIQKQIVVVLPTSLQNMTLETRRAYFAQGYSQMKSPYGIVDADWIRGMPSAAERAAVARRLYMHPAVRDSPMERTKYLSYLPFPEAVKIGAEYVASDDVEIRCCMIRACLASLEYYPEHLPAALEFCVHRLKEEDRWRTAMFEAWGALRHGFWRRTSMYVSDDALQSSFAQLFEAAHSAKDASHRTLQEMQYLTRSLLGLHPSFAVHQLARLIHKQKQFLLGGHGMHNLLYLVEFYPRALPILAAELLPVAQRFFSSDDEWTGVRILDSLLETATVAKTLLRESTPACNGGPSIWPLLHDTLTAGLSADEYTAEVVFGLYLKNFPQELVRELPDIIAEQKDWVDSREVQLLACNAVQGPLLDMLVGPIENLPKSRFYKHRKPLVRVCELPVNTACRWTSSQQVRYAQSCLRVLYTPGALTSFECRALIENLARLPSVSSTTSWTDGDGKKRSLISLATEEHPDHGRCLMGVALQALSHLSNDAEATKTILDALNRADSQRDALRALAERLRCAPTADAVRLLDPMLNGTNVSPQKEALHLLGAKHDDVAYARLLQFAADHHLPMPVAEAEGGPAESSCAPSATPGTPPVTTGGVKTAMHRDVRAALVKALFNFLDRPQVWWYYTSIVTQDYEAVQTLVGAEESPTSDHDASGSDADEEDDASTGDSDRCNETTITPSSAACKAMLMLKWSLLRLDWQLQEYWTLLRRLFRHPLRSLRIATLHKLATAPPYDDLALCKVVSEYLEEDTTHELVDSALTCMLACTAEEAPSFIAASIVQIKSDVSMEVVTSTLFRIARCNAAPARKTLLTVVGEVTKLLIADRRQPTIIVSLISQLDLPQWLSRLTEMETAGMMHPGAAKAVIDSVKSYPAFMCDMDAVERLEETMLRRHPSAFMRRVGLAILLSTCRSRGWNKQRRASLAVYCADDDLCVSSDARLVAPK
ncbi:hypothetical protein JKF63_03941 [Porcisia hertigi]|uniref:Uncharacterized protein n=1 Tax=Porcisia hertigi TaxID=2761500 RepID=A0A836L7H3_9TRYP|nr:hypothetical protein JKF63_03941 [Porcisia hertigi]